MPTIEEMLIERNCQIRQLHEANWILLNALQELKKGALSVSALVDEACQKAESAIVAPPK